MFRVLCVLFLCGILCAGCAWGEQPQWGETGKAVTFRMTCKGELDPEFTYRIAIDTDGDALTGPSSNPREWNNVYILEWRNGNAFLLSLSGTRTYLLESSFFGQTAEAKISLEALGSPEQLEVMALVEDSGGNILDRLRTFFTIRLKYQQSVFRSDEEGDASNPSGDILRLSVEVSF